MGVAKTGSVKRLAALAAMAMLLVLAVAGPASAQTYLFKEPEITVVAGQGDADRMKELIQQRTELNTQDSNGRTALVTATIARHANIVGMLLGAGARSDIADKLGNTPLSWAASQGDRDIAKLLIDDGADINHANRQGLTPLMLASSKSHYDVVKLLIDAHANLDLQDYTGRSALGWARGGRDRRVEQALEDAGAQD